MFVKIVFGQRKEGYPGEFAPEALAIIDEYSDADNPNWINEQLEVYKKDKSFLNVRIMNVKVNQDEIRNFLTHQPYLDGKVQND